MHTQKMINKIVAVALAFVLAFSCATVYEPLNAQAASSLSSIMSSFSDARKGGVVSEMSNLFFDHSIEDDGVSDSFKKIYNSMGSWTGNDELWTQFVAAAGSEDSAYSVLNSCWSVVLSYLNSATGKGLFSSVCKLLGVYFTDVGTAYTADPETAIKILEDMLPRTHHTGTVSTFTIDDDDEVEIDTTLQDDVKTLVDAYTSSKFDYVLVSSYAYTSLTADTFKTKDIYEHSIACYKYNLENVCDVMVGKCDWLSGGDIVCGFFSKGFSYFYCPDSSWNGDSDVSLYDSNWNLISQMYYYISDSYYVADTSVYDFASYNTTRAGFSSLRIRDGSFKFFTLDGHDIRIWLNLNAMKNFSVGKQSVYFISNYTTYSPTTTTYSGNYINNSNIENDYSSIQERIDNSTTTVDESTVNNIVNNYYTTNNYNSDTDDGGGSSSDDSGSSWLDTIIDGAGSLISGLVSLIGVLAGAIGDLLVAVTDIIGSVMDSISNLTGSFGDFGTFLGETFSFIPDEVWSAIALGFEVCVLLMAVNFIKGFI